MYIFRKLSAAKKNSLRWLFFSYLKRHYSYKYGFQIPKETKIGEGLFLGHFGTVVINKDSIIGKNCNIAHGVTIGQVNLGRFKGCPRIGDKVWIGTGAVLVGNIVIGNNVLIAPNSYVNFDVPENSLVIGNPAKIIPRENPTNGYINNILN
jgi:serine O-acetyltransferase